MKILLIGRNGQVGSELMHALPHVGELVFTDRSTLDLADPASIARAIRAHRPDVIVNAAAYTAVDKAESDVPKALAVNSVAPGVMASEAKALDALLIHYSTDYVFDGSKAGAYVEDDRTGPLGAYGRSKLEGETHIRQVGCRHLILRTSWVYGPHGANFLRTMLRFAGWFGDPPREELRVVDDQIGAPTPAALVAEVTAAVVPRVLVAPALGDTYHLTAAGEASWHGVASFIADDLRARGHDVTAPLPVPTASRPLPARRPLNSRLDTARLHRAFGLKMPAWPALLAQTLAAWPQG